MTVNELIAELQALTPEQRELPVFVEEYDDLCRLTGHPREGEFWDGHDRPAARAILVGN